MTKTEQLDFLNNMCLEFDLTFDELMTIAQDYAGPNELYLALLNGRHINID